MDFNNLGLELLGKMISTGALHNSAERYDASKCHPQKREVVLKEIMDWIIDDENYRNSYGFMVPWGQESQALPNPLLNYVRQHRF